MMIFVSFQACDEGVNIFQENVPGSQVAAIYNSIVDKLIANLKSRESMDVK
jgi:hypothetical protein